MSDSRLEKFIYAICSTDVSDLPVPLSRIEKLWNCLITGETPDFEPLSRNEKYLMAMLDRYDISNLPAPMSRGEKLLYKIAVGETDLSDVPDYLSRYEELLKYLIENGGISGGDFEYVLYTLNQSMYTLYTTAEKPVKSAILSGKTLVNLWGQAQEDFFMDGNGSFDNGVVTANGWCCSKRLELFKPNTEYTLITKVISVSDSNTCFIANNVSNGIFKTETKRLTSEGIYVEKVLSISDLTKGVFSARSVVMGGGTVKYSMIILEGDHTQSPPVDYFEGMQSVKMPVLTTYTNLFTGFINRGFIDTYGNAPALGNNENMLSDFIEVKFNSIAFRRFKKDGTPVNSFGEFAFYDKNKNFISRRTAMDKVDESITLPNNTRYIRIWSKPVDKDDGGWDELAMLIYSNEAPSQIKSYLDNKTNILTVNEDVVLRGIGDVKDTLDCLTGEVTERIGEIVLDGSEDEEWDADTPMDTINRYRLRLVNSKNIIDYSDSINCDKWRVFKPVQYQTENQEGIYINGWVDMLEIGVDVSRLSENSLSGFKQWLSVNPLIVQFLLDKEVIKTVDLTVVDQDNQPTELGTFKNVTHVSLVAENLIPEVEMEVATKISEELASASPLMDDISTEQQQLNTTVNVQSNNVDATMIATTEIFEETL